MNPKPNGAPNELRADSDSNIAADAAGSAPSNPSRRRLIRAGASSVPVVATLSSRPVLGATTCSTTSAWGSALLMPTAASVQARTASHALTVNAWTIAQWRDDTSSGGPWNALYSTKGAAWNFTSGVSNFRNQLLVSQLFEGSVPSGLQSLATNRVLRILNNAGTYPFQTSVVVAKLNLWTTATTNVGACITSQQLSAMGSGLFTPSIGGNPWAPADIQNYLSQNGIAAP